MKGALKLDLPCLLSLSITSDGWTSTLDKYVSVACHYLRTGFIYNSFTMDTILMNESNTSKNISSAIKLTLEEWEIPVQESSIPIYCITDNGANFKSADSIYFIHWQCFAHTLQNAISDSKRETPRVITLLSKCNSSAKQRLHNIQKQLNFKQLDVIQYVDTRWSSEHAMLKRMIEMQDALNAELASPHNTNTSMLQPLAEATEELCGDNYPTSSMVIPVLHCLESHLNKCIVKKIEGITFARNLSKSIKSKFTVYEEDKVYLLSMLTDPRFRGVLVNKIVAVANLQAELNKYRSFETQPLEEQPGLSTTTSSLWSAIDDLPNESLFDPATDEIERYLGEKRIPRREDPLIWWKEK
uniref:Uncharacterized protein n=1 Tax=Timema cristinae TaxID=61476 RepID=A0A7R9CQA8_TIMCR|nr:unnamed protein product [Timema cristinae]